MPKRPKTIKPQNILKVAVIGRPNVGKSSLFNKLIGEDRVIVSDLAHTTREPHDTLVSYTPPEESEFWGGEETFISFVDTAGIRKKPKSTAIWNDRVWVKALTLSTVRIWFYL